MKTLGQLNAVFARIQREGGAMHPTLILGMARHHCKRRDPDETRAWIAQFNLRRGDLGQLDVCLRYDLKTNTVTGWDSQLGAIDEAISESLTSARNAAIDNPIGQTENVIDADRKMLLSNYPDPARTDSDAAPRERLAYPKSSDPDRANAPRGNTNPWSKRKINP